PNPCLNCQGDGRVRKQRTMKIRIPAGVSDGTRIQLSSQGEVGPGGGPAGDLFVEVMVTRHDVFQRDGDHLRASVSVPMTAAARARANPAPAPARPEPPSSSAGPPATTSSSAMATTCAPPCPCR